MELKSSTPPIGFLGLPVEIRRLIYQYCLVRRDPFIIPDRFIGFERLSQCRIRDQRNSLLLVSKMVGAEALEVLYGDNAFQIDICHDGVCHLTGEFWEVNRRRIGKLQVVLQPFTSGWGPYCCVPDSTPWSPLLAQLKKLTIVAQHPLRFRRYYTAETIEKSTEWLMERLQCYSSELRSSCVVEVDDDNQTDTGALMRICFPRGYRRVQTLAGNLLFQGSRYYTDSDYCSGGSDYWNQIIPTWFGERHPPCVTGPAFPYRSGGRDVRLPAYRAVERSLPGS